ncbi:PfkB family carbohydrate kinase [Kibdelosporangium persicum]|uniref:D-glycero-beta-D-manno-heptose 1-phosphate adenylyltransferase n=1 Tax=Kibdelosporangium persicum TaxID=2698649 RepID=A0ABX2F889_9PSEU|nr:PfkB family carbohydrate kinase [Kibdelosporangium persicum]NRN67568.1 D-glycero-beta-D-manno-heptose 1-phosphate adenylyltransferase [Kibdelosporangium persicum]
MNLVVVGDCLLDTDLVGTSTRLCPDAPVPVLDVEDELVRPGGAGLAATLAATFADADVTLVTVIADDADGDRLRKALNGTPLVAGPSWTPTPVKTRLRSGGQSIARIDRGGSSGNPVVTGEMLDAIRCADTVLVSDYGRGLAANQQVRDVLSSIADEVPVVWDPHPRGPRPIPGARLVTPNTSEAMNASGCATHEDAAAELRRRWLADAVVITLGSRGALLDAGTGPVLVPAPTVQLVDPCGAGDCFAVTAATRLMAGDDHFAAVFAGVVAASRFVAQAFAEGDSL